MVKKRKGNNHRHKTDKRVHPRFILSLPLEINTSRFHLLTRTKNISCSGIYCEINRYIPLRTKLSVSMKLSFFIDGKKVQRTVNCPAEVVRIDPPTKRVIANYNVGIVFSGIKEKNRDLILQYVHQKNLKEAKQLKKIYLGLKEMEAKLVELEESHPTAEHFRKVIVRAIGDLDAVAHILDYEINELKNLD